MMSVRQEDELPHVSIFELPHNLQPPRLYKQSIVA